MCIRDRTWAVPAIPGHDVMEAVSCASTSVCVAVGLNATVATTHDGGYTWRVKTITLDHILNMFVGISCPSEAVCYAATRGGLVFKSNDGGMSWDKKADLGINFRGMDCPTTDVCYLASPQIGQSVIAMTVDGGARWSAAILPLVLVWSLSCSSDRNCVGVGTCHSIFSCLGYQAVVTTDGGATWRGTDITTNSPEFVSCGSTTICVAVGATGPGEIPGGIQVSSDGGLTWTDQPIIDLSLLRGVSCNLGSCWAVGDRGAILAS